MKKSLVAILTLSLLLTASCATMEEHKGATVGGAAGAATGVVIGGIAGGTRGAVIGGLLGALAGGAVGHYAYDQKKGQEATNKTYGYKGDRPGSATIESVQVIPTSVKPGQQVNLKCTYAVLAQTDQTVSIREVREIYFGNDLWGSPEVQVDRRGGTYESSIPLVLPKDAKKGTYRVRYMVQTDTSKDMRDASFRVQ